MPLHRGAPRPWRKRWALGALRRARLGTAIHEAAQLMQLIIRMDVLNPVLAYLLVASRAPPALVWVMLFSSRRLYTRLLVEQLRVCARLVEALFETRHLGAAGSGGALPVGQRRSAPPRLTDWSDDLCFTLLRFHSWEIWELMRYFGLLRDDGSPRVFQIYSSGKLYHRRGQLGSYAKWFVCSADTAFMLLLCHMARPGGYVDLQPFFNGMPGPEMSKVVNFLLLYLIPWYDMGSHIERYVDRFRLYADAIAAAGAPLNELNQGDNTRPNIIGFTDGTHYATCRPGGLGNHRMTLRDFECYNGHHRSHGINVLGINFPDGHVCLSKPYTGNRHDGAMWAAMGIYHKLRRLRQLNFGFWVIFGDSAFPAGEHCHKMLTSASERWQRAYNYTMAKLRISAEWMFKDMGRQWARLGQTKTHKLCGMNVGGRVQLAALLWNCKNSFHGSQTSQYFKVPVMSLRRVLGPPRAGRLPPWVRDA